MIIAGKFTLDLISINLHELDRNINLSITCEWKDPSLCNSNPIAPTTRISRVYHCNGLLAFLCDSRIVVWNPYWGKTRRIDHSNNYSSFAFGYDRSCGSHKILRIFYNKLEFYDLSSSKSWRVLNATPDQNIVMCYKSGVSVKGNAYRLARDQEEQGYFFLICFDFTREIFGPRLPLPFNSTREANVSLSSVKEERLVVLFAGDIWITNKVESDVVSWKKFLKYDMRQLPKYSEIKFFLIDEEKNAAVIIYEFTTVTTLYLFGKGGYVICVRNYQNIKSSTIRMCSYVPSVVQINSN